MAPDKIEVDKIETLAEAVSLIKVLIGELVTLRSRVRVLEEENSRLKKNSSNSSKPPSSDIVKPEGQRRQPGKRKSGAQPGHEGKSRVLFPAEMVNTVDERTLSECPSCHGSLEKQADEQSIIHQVVELRQQPLEITEYRRHSYWCESCQKRHYGDLPDGVDPLQICGPRLQALMAYMKGNFGASYAALQQFCSEVLFLPISLGALGKVIKRLSQALSVPYNELAQEVPRQELLHIDETGWSDKGKRLWVWIFCNTAFAYFTIQASRGCEVLKQVLGETFNGAIVSDFYGAYVKYANPRQQFCLAHLIRDIKFLATLPDLETAKCATKLLAYFRRLFKLWHSRSTLSDEELQQKCKRLKRKFFTFLHSSEIAPGCKTIKKRLLKHWESLFRFVSEQTLIEPTNNHAERNLRHLVKLRRLSQDSRSVWGKLWAARIMTTLQTCRLQKRSPLTFLNQAISAKLLNTQPPSLAIP